MKLCKDCKWCKSRQGYLPNEFSRCSHPVSKLSNDDLICVVTGEIIIKAPVFYKCVEMRNGECGMEAKYYENIT